MSAPANPTIAEALQYADGLPADCFADRCILALAAEVLRLRAPLREDTPWPLRDVIAKLSQSAEILLHQKNYDGDGWEQLQHAHEAAKEILANWPKP